MKDFLESKKFVAAVVGVLAVIASALLEKLGVNVPDDKLYAGLMLLATFILGQGIADHGKEKAKVEAVAEAAKKDVEGNHKGKMIAATKRAIRRPLSETRGNELLEPSDK